MKPFDARLLRFASAARTVLTVGAVLGLIRTLAIIAWSWCLAMALATVAVPVIESLQDETLKGSRVAEGVFALSDLPWLLCGALLAVLVRSAAGWGMDVVAARGAVKVKSQLRTAALDALDARSPSATSSVPDAHLTATLGRGLDALDGYFSGYLPQLILAVVATPILLATVMLTDLTSGIIVLIVFPIIPIFMILIGMATQSVQERQWSQLQHLGASFLDVVEGLATLKIFRREAHQVARIARETDEYRTRTMKVLRVTFLSGFVLDLAGTFSIALVAVTVGTQLVDGAYPLALGLFVLLLLPEVFVPVRQVGAAFHASTEGLAASAGVFALIEGDGADVTATPTSGAVTAPPQAYNAETTRGVQQADSMEAGAQGAALIELSDVRIERSTALGTVPARVGPVTMRVSAGEYVALVGPSGAGKSSIISAALGFLSPASGELQVRGPIAWAGQRPGLIQGTVLDNVALGADHADEALARQALDDLGLSGIALDYALGALGAGLSGGQSQRVAVARALYRARSVHANVLLLDEPSSALDATSEQLVIDVARAEARRGRAVLVVSHRQAMIDAADRVIHVSPQRPIESLAAPTASEARS